MKHAIRVALAVCALAVNAAFADDNRVGAALRLMDAMQTATLLQRTIEATLHAEIQKNPAIAPYKTVMLRFFHKHMGYESLKTEMAALYADTFTIEEMNQLVLFYQSPVGRKSIDTLPELTTKGSQMGVARVQDNMAELQAMIKEESERIQTLQAEPK